MVTFGQIMAYEGLAVTIVTLALCVIAFIGIASGKWIPYCPNDG